MQRVQFLSAVGVTLFVLASCRHSGRPVGVEEPPPVKPSAPVSQPPTEALMPVEVRVPVVDPNRWLFVEQFAGAANGSATGSFDPARNKLSIQTKDVTKFAVDTSRIRIDWTRLVILSINGRNSELRRRDFDLYHFALTDQREWVVVEP